MRIETIDINKIKEYPNNAKLHPQEHIEQIKKSIEEFGNNDPIAVDENNVIIEGHGRLYALKELGHTECEIIRLTHLTEEQKRAYILAHNKLTMNTGFDLEILSSELDSIFDIDMGEFGFDLSEGQGEDEEIIPDVSFTEVLGEEHNYVVLYFDNEVDWLQAETMFDIQKVKALSTRKDGSVSASMVRRGVGRVLNGAKALEQIKNEYQR